jgi:hypothetical protein
MDKDELELEKQRLALEVRRVQAEERMARHSFWTRLGVAVPIVAALIAFGGTLWSQHNERRDKIDLQKLQAKDAFELKVVELVMDTTGPFETRARAKAIKQLFPSRLGKGFASRFDPEQASDRKTFERDQRVASKKELLKLLADHPEERMKDPGFLGGSDARLCPGGRRCSSDGQTEEVLR